MAAPPVSRETYLAEMAALREHILKTKTAGNVEQAIQAGNLVKETVYKLAERWIMSVASLEEKMANMEGTTLQALATERTTAQAVPIERKRKSLVESKCVGNMKTRALTKQSSECGMESL